jgi:hypothetical protein
MLCVKFPPSCTASKGFIRQIDDTPGKAQRLRSERSRHRAGCVDAELMEVPALVDLGGRGNISENVAAASMRGRHLDGRGDLRSGLAGAQRALGEAQGEHEGDHDERDADEEDIVDRAGEGAEHE